MKDGGRDVGTGGVGFLFRGHAHSTRNTHLEAHNLLIRYSEGVWGRRRGKG